MDCCLWGFFVRGSACVCYFPVGVWVWVVSHHPLRVWCVGHTPPLHRCPGRSMCPDTWTHAFVLVRVGVCPGGFGGGHGSAECENFTCPVVQTQGSFTFGVYDALVASRISVARRFTNLIRSGLASVCSMAP